MGVVRQVMHIHISRTAGKSIRAWAKQNASSFQILSGGRNQFDPDASWTYFPDWDRGPNPTGKLDFLMEKRGVTREWYDRVFTFAIVRNSWDRLVSLFAYLTARRAGKGVPPSGNFADFDTFVRDVTNNGKGWSEQQLCGRASGEYRCPQTFWLQWGVDYTARQEHLVGDWRLLCMKVGLKYKPLPIKNTSIHHDYREWYTPKQRKMVGDYYAEEIETYGFRFDGEKKRKASGAFTLHQQQHAFGGRNKRSRKIVGQRILNEYIAIIPSGKTVIDMGTGAGNAVRSLRDSGYEALGIDGTPDVETFVDGEVLWADLAGDCDKFHGVSDWGIFTEVGEHVPRELESKLMDNVCAIPKEGIIASWAEPGSRGLGHVNCQELDYVCKLFKQRGWSPDAMATERYNNSVKRRKLYVFRKAK